MKEKGSALSIKLIGLGVSLPWLIVVVVVNAADAAAVTVAASLQDFSGAIAFCSYYNYCIFGSFGFQLCLQITLFLSLYPSL